MSHCVVWIEHDHAKVFSYSPEGSQKSEIKNKYTGSHHTGHFEQEKKNNLKKYYHDLAQQLKDAEKLLLVGPGLAKTEFRNHLEQDHKALAKNIIGIETLDKSTDGEIQNLAKKFFQKYDLFHP